MGQPERPLVTTSWQLIAGGACLLPLAVVAEGLPTQPLTGQNLLGYGYLTLIGAALAYTLWFRGIQALPVGSITFLSRLSPVVAVLGGWESNPATRHSVRVGTRSNSQAASVRSGG